MRKSIDVKNHNEDILLDTSTKKNDPYTQCCLISFFVSYSLL